MAARLFYVAALLGSLHVAADRSNQTLQSTWQTQKLSDESYTSNSLCRQHNCINPIFPGLNDMPRLESLTWQCSSQTAVKQYMNFCKEAVPYDPALPNPIKGATPVSMLVKAMDDAAMTMFYYHLNGMGYDGWDYRTPSTADNDCIQSVWKMVCFTYFPRANAGCNKGQVSLYQRPCQSSCQNYINHCNVECCDESVQCSFVHKANEIKGNVSMSVLQTGYVAEDGPSAKCTGGARRSMTSPFFLILALFGFQWALGADSAQPSQASTKTSRSGLWRRLPIFVLVIGLAISLQGCDADVPTHSQGNWRAKSSYLTDYRFLPSGANAQSAILNSCSNPNLVPTQQCNGRGYCSGFNPTVIPGMPSALGFCFCDDGYADPECGTERKSQFKAFLHSVFLGLFGADQFYLGFPLTGIAKLVTGIASLGFLFFGGSPFFGGLLTLSGSPGILLLCGGFWWLIDIVRIASGPVYAYNFRTANDLSHAWAILFLVFISLMIGFFAAIESYLGYRTKRRNDIAHLEHDEASSHWQNTKQHVMQMYGATPQTYAPQSSLSGMRPTANYSGFYKQNEADPSSEMAGQAEAEY